MKILIIEVNFFFFFWFREILFKRNPSTTHICKSHKIVNFLYSSHPRFPCPPHPPLCSYLFFSLVFSLGDGFFGREGRLPGGRISYGRKFSKFALVVFSPSARKLTRISLFRGRIHFSCRQ